MILFDWDPKKHTKNIEKHGVTFEEAESSFYDELSLIIDDPIHSENEERFILIGLSFKTNLLVVSHCYRHESGSEEIIRIISARKATKKEAQVYNERNNL